LFFFLSQQGGRGCVFAVFFAPIPEKGISDFIAHGSIIQVLTVFGNDFESGEAECREKAGIYSIASVRISGWNIGVIYLPALLMLGRNRGSNEPDIVLVGEYRYFSLVKSTISFGITGTVLA